MSSVDAYISLMRGDSGPSGPTWDPVKAAATPGATLSLGNLLYTKVTGGDNIVNVVSSTSNNSGVRYFEVTFAVIGAGQSDVGLCNSSTVLHTNSAIDSMGGIYAVMRTNGQFFAESGTFLGFDASYVCVSGDVIGVKIDFSTGTISWRKNGGSFTFSSAHFAPGATLFIIGPAEQVSNSIFLNLSPSSPPGGTTPWT